MFYFLVVQFALISNPYFICKFCVTLFCRLLQLRICFVGYWSGTLTYCVHRGSPLLHFLFSVLRLVLVYCHLHYILFSAFTHQQEPTLLYYRKKGAIPTLVVGRNPYYRTGDHTGSIPQDPWVYFSKFQFLVLFFSLVQFFIKYSLESCLFTFLVIAEPPQGQSKPIWPQYQLLLAILWFANHSTVQKRPNRISENSLVFGLIFCPNS